MGWNRVPTLVGQRRVPLDDYRANLDRLITDATTRGVEVSLLQPVNRIRLADLSRTSPTTHSWAAWFDAQRDVAEVHDVPVIDVRDVLQATGLSGDAAFLDDMHPTGAANAALAARLAQEIRARGWLGSARPPASGSAPDDPPRPHSTGGSPP